MAGRLWWLLKCAGKDNVYLLKGGIKKWLENNLAVTTLITEPVVSDFSSLKLNHFILASNNDVKKS